MSADVDHDFGVDGIRHPRRWWALGFIVTANLLVYSGVTIMNVALPAAQEDLGLSDPARQWVITIFALTFGGLILLGGRIADTFGLRRSMIAGLLGYAAASVIGASAPASWVLLAARAAQGATGALVAASVLALLSALFPRGNERGTAFGVLGAVMGIGGAGAFIVGGALTELSWRWCLMVSAPVALVTALGLSWTVAADSPPRRQRLDLRGAALITAAVAALIVGFDRASQDGWGTETTIVSLLAGVGLLAWFIVAEHRVTGPLLPLAIVTDRTRGAAYVSVFVLGIGMFAGFFLLTSYLQEVRGYSPTRTGMAFLPFGLAAMASSRFVAPALMRRPPVTLLVGGLIATAAALGYLTRLDRTTGYVVGVLPTFVLLGLGATAVMVTASNVATIDAGSHSGVAGGAIGASQQIGAALGTALLGSIATSASGAYRRAHDVSPGDLDAAVHGYTRASATGAVLVAIGAVAARLLSPRQSQRAKTPSGSTARPQSAARATH